MIQNLRIFDIDLFCGFFLNIEFLQYDK